LAEIVTTVTTLAGVTVETGLTAVTGETGVTTEARDCEALSGPGTGATDVVAGLGLVSTTRGGFAGVSKLGSGVGVALREGDADRSGDADGIASLVGLVTGSGMGTSRTTMLESITLKPSSPWPHPVSATEATRDPDTSQTRAVPRLAIAPPDLHVTVPILPTNMNTLPFCRERPTCIT
jgi:hypothetical protein